MSSKHARRSRASKKGASPSPSPTPRSPQSPPIEPSKADSPPSMNYANSLLPEAERLKRQGRVAAQDAQQTRIKADPEQYREKLTDLEKAIPGMAHSSLLCWIILANIFGRRQWWTESISDWQMGMLYFQKDGGKGRKLWGSWAGGLSLNDGGL